MNKKGFTLVEILAVIAIIGVILIVTIPSFIHLFNVKNQEIEEVSRELVNNAATLYLEKNNYDFDYGDIYCLTIINLINEDFLSSEFIEESSLFHETDTLQINVLKNNYITTEVNNDCVAIKAIDYYLDNSGAEKPVLKDRLIPITFSESGVLKANLTEEWYDYDSKQWANAVLVSEASFATYDDENYEGLIAAIDILGYFVWIPRYRYQLFNVDSEIITKPTVAVRFENIRSVKTVNDENGKWLTHPAFTFGDKELTGFWFGKYITTGINSAPTVLENEAMLQNQYVGDHYIAVTNFKNNFNLLDARISKNTEWGAVLLLANSLYGNDAIWANANTNYLTGCAGNVMTPTSSTTCNRFNTENGKKASTTGNVYGVYDTSGGAYEATMGVMLELSGTFLDVAESGFAEINNLAKKYVNRYQFGTTSNDIEAYQRRILGDATSEVRGFDGNDQEFIYHENSFFLRGGNINNSGIFSFNNSPGNQTSGFRIVISEE